MHIIAIANMKGGVGKTTTAINLSAALCARAHKVLLIDVDPQAHASMGLGVIPPFKSLADVIIEPSGVESAIIPTAVRNLFILPASHNLASLEMEPPPGLGKSALLRNVIEALPDSFDYLLLDSPPSLSLLSLSVLACARFVIIPVVAEFLSLPGLVSMLKVIDGIRERENRDLRILGVLITMYDSRTNLSREVRTELESNFPERVFEVVVPRCVRAAEAPSYGLPVTEYARSSTVAMAYHELAAEVERTLALNA